MRDVIIFGIQGSGKGTQAALLDEKYDWEFAYFSTGDLFRTLQSSDNAIGNYIKKSLSEGQLIDDRVTNTMFEAYFYTVMAQDKYMILDGYPRSVKQLEFILKLFKDNGRKPLGIWYEVADDVVKERMRLRGREDDTEESIAKRIGQFYEKTMPVIEYFQEHADIASINADDTIENIHEKTIEVVQKYI